MISTVVTSTIPSIPVTVVAAVGLIILLAARELADASDREWLSSMLTRNLLVFATPLLISFIITVIVKVARAA